MRFNVYTEMNGSSLTGFVMCAPIEVIRKAFGLHLSMVERIERDRVSGSCTTVCFNNRPNFLGVNNVHVIAASFDSNFDNNN